MGFDPGRPSEGFRLTGMRERTKNAGGLWWGVHSTEPRNPVDNSDSGESPMNGLRVGDQR